MGRYKIAISEFVVKKLQSRKEGESGNVYIIEADDVLSALAITLPLNGADAELNETEIGLPFGLACWGSFHCTSDLSSISSTTELRLITDPNSGDISAFYQENSGYESVEYSILSEADITSNFYLIRVRATFPVTFEFSEEGVREMIEKLRKSTDGAIRLPEFGNHPQDQPYSLPVKNRVYKTFSDVDVLECSLQLKQALEVEDDEPRKALIINCVTRSVKCCSFDLRLDSLSWVPRESTVKEIIEDYVEVNLRRSLTLSELCLIGQLQDQSTFSIPEFYHFLPHESGHFVSVAYPKRKLDRDLADVRAKFHTAYALPTDRPLFLRGNSFQFSAKVISNGELENPHLDVKHSGIVNGEPACVQGRYAYHHYCQSGESDDGWGCAYRSLQTLSSWFKLQGYTNRPVPTIREIQQCLVSIGDKPSSFVGSRQWIGSTEVGYCLDTLLGIACRIVSVSSGDEMSMKGGELSHHFKTQGTPVMIGGGNLAHTILGVDYNKKTGDIKFLILDPHYTGPEDLATIVTKGWCGWKGPEFWKKGSFYNMCMPIRPKCI